MVLEFTDDLRDKLLFSFMAIDDNHVNLFSYLLNHLPNESFLLIA